jgi:long-chain acyl-CoA synthetase
MEAKAKRTNLASYLDDFLLRRDEIAFSHRDGLRVKAWSYCEIARTAAQFASELETRQVAQGDRVLFWARNSPQWVAAFFGCLLRGAIAVPIDLHSEPDFVRRVQDQVKAKLVLTDAATLDFTGQVIPAISLDQLTDLTAHHPTTSYPITGINPDDIVEIVFTSGTTAEPKGVAITHRNLLANLTPLEREIGRYLKWERLVHPVRFLNLVPLSHVFGQFMGIFVPQLLGGAVFFQESLLPSQIIETVKREHISVIICVPRSLESLREKIERDYEAGQQLDQFRKDFDHTASSHLIRRWWKFRRVHQIFGWKFWAFISGGATLNPDTEEFWQRLGFAVIQGYGMTETAAIISVNHPFRKARGSIGKVLPGQAVKLSENGEILVRGENVSRLYWNDKGEAAAAENHWFGTGDAGEIDAAGNLYFKGRKKEVIVTSAGMNVYPEDIELVLERQPEIKRNVVVEIDGAHGPEPLAVLIPRDEKANVAAAIERANRSLAQHQQVRRWAIWPAADFPLTATQKVRKQVVADQMKARLTASSSETPAGSSAELAKIVAQVSGEPARGLPPSARLGADLKLDSLGRVELLSALEDSYRVEFDEAAFTETTTLGEVERLIREGKQDEPAQYPYPRWQERWPVSWLRIALFYLIVWPFTRVLARPEIRGRKNLQGLNGPLVFVCNHITLADHALVLLALPPKIRSQLAIAMDGELLREWRHPPRATKLSTRLLQLIEYVLVVLFFNVFSMPQKSGFRRSFAFAGKLMDRGYSILIFPEGERTKHGQMNPFRPGTGLLISQLDSAVVPLRIDGLWELKQANRHFARGGEVSVFIGKPVSYSAQTSPEVISQDLERRVKTL